MSIEIVLVPIALAGVAAWQARKAAQTDAKQILANEAQAAGANMAQPNRDLRQAVAVQTRMKSEALLEHALRESGASVLPQSPDALIARWGSTSGHFTRDAAGVWSVHFDGTTDLGRAEELVRLLDAHYGRLVQGEVLARLRAGAAGAGMDIESEKQEVDDSVTLVLNVNAVG